MAVAELDRARVRQTGGRERALHHHLVHRDRRADDARPHVRQVGQLEQALHGAVLAVGAVQQREHDVDVERADRGRDLAVDRERARAAPSGPASMARWAESASSHRPSVVIATGTTS